MTYQELVTKLIEIQKHMMPDLEKFARALRDHYDDFNDFMRRNIAEYEVLAGQLPEAFAHPLGQ